MKRSYQWTLDEHLQHHRQMFFLTGPRQVGKTTLCRSLVESPAYLNWDNQDHRTIILGGPERVSEATGLTSLRASKPVVIFDEIHKYPRWKTFLKGFFDTYSDRVKIVVTGSSRLDIFNRGGDSLMGRYFSYRLHPLSAREVCIPEPAAGEIQNHHRIDDKAFDDLMRYGGFPEPFLKAETRFYNRWKRLRQQLLLREDLRDLTRVQGVDQIEILAELLKHQAGQLVNYSRLASRIKVSVDTVRRWITVLRSLYYCFTLQPWTRSIPRSLLKQPKVYLWDWAMLDDAGARLENFVASHLLKAVHWWTDNGDGEFDLYFIRDKDKREVDFLVTRNKKPWFLAEVKAGHGSSLNKNLFYFQEMTGAGHAFQISFSLDYEDADCFSTTYPVIVPAKTFLSQLV